MAHLDSVSIDYLQKIAADIGHLVSGTMSPGMLNMANIEAPGPSLSALRLTETLTVWKLTPEAFDALADSSITGDLIDWVIETPSLYHQIKLGSEPQGFARSLIKQAAPSDSEAASTSETEETPNVVLSQISSQPERAQRVDQALRLAENYKPEEGNSEDSQTDYDPVVRLLEIPPYHVVALWLYDESSPDPSQKSTVAIIDGPIRDTTLTQNSFLTSEQFFAALSRIGPIIGVVLRSREMENTRAPV